MSRILDLNQFVGSYITVSLPCGTEIKINKPSERLKIKLMACVEEQIQLQSLGVQGLEVSQNRQIAYIDMLEDLIQAILNNNRECKFFDIQYVKSYFGEIDMINALLLAYKDFIEEGLSNPN